MRDGRRCSRAPRRIVAVDVSRAKIDLAGTLGATHWVQADPADPRPTVEAHPRGRGRRRPRLRVRGDRAAGDDRAGDRRAAAGRDGRPRRADAVRPGRAFEAFPFVDGGRRIIGSNYGSAVAAVDFPRYAEAYLAGPPADRPAHRPPAAARGPRRRASTGSGPARRRARSCVFGEVGLAGAARQDAVDGRPRVGVRALAERDLGGPQVEHAVRLGHVERPPGDRHGALSPVSSTARPRITTSSGTAGSWCAWSANRPSSRSSRSFADPSSTTVTRRSPDEPHDHGVDPRERVAADGREEPLVQPRPAGGGGAPWPRGRARRPRTRPRTRGRRPRRPDRRPGSREEASAARPSSRLSSPRRNAALAKIAVTTKARMMSSRSSIVGTSMAGAGRECVSA